MVCVRGRGEGNCVYKNVHVLCMCLSVHVCCMNVCVCGRKVQVSIKSGGFLPHTAVTEMRKFMGRCPLHICL